MPSQALPSPKHPHPFPALGGGCQYCDSSWRDEGSLQGAQDQVGESSTNGSSPALSQGLSFLICKMGIASGHPVGLFPGPLFGHGGVGMKPRAEELCLPLSPFLFAR